MGHLQYIQIGHTGSVMTLRKGGIVAQSLKQKLNTCSSTEAEISAVDDAMGHVDKELFDMAELCLRLSSTQG